MRRAHLMTLGPSIFGIQLIRTPNNIFMFRRGLLPASLTLAAEISCQWSESSIADLTANEQEEF